MENTQSERKKNILIFISYSWQNKEIVDDIDSDFKRYGVDLIRNEIGYGFNIDFIRDTRDLGYKDSIKKFMAQINNSDYVLMVISKGYLESKNCMYEVLELLENKDFTQRILPIVLTDANIFGAKSSIKYIDYWAEEIKNSQKELGRINPTYAKSLLEEIEEFTKIRDNIDKFISVIKDLNCKDLATLKEENYKSILGYIKKHSSGKKITAGFKGIEQIIFGLSEPDFNSISTMMENAKAVKFYTLLKLYRENSLSKKNKLSDDQIQHQLEITSNAFYVLKSRLYEKIQDYLTQNLGKPEVGSRNENITIPKLLYETERETARAILAKKEVELVKKGMYDELSSVYSALKHLSLNSPKHLYHVQAYNNNVAFTLALDKARDLLFEFVRIQAEYYTTRDKSVLSTPPELKREMDNLARMYSSHHLKVYKNIMDISLTIFLPLQEVVKQEDSVENLLLETQKILLSYSNDINYKYLQRVIDYLAFENYHLQTMHEEGKPHFEAINKTLSFFLLYNHSCFCSKFLIYKLERYVNLNIENQLYDENEKGFYDYQADKEDIPNYVNYWIYLAASAYYSDRQQEAIALLSGLIKHIDVEKHIYSGLETRLFLTVCHVVCDEDNSALQLLEDISQILNKMDEANNYQNVQLLVKIIREIIHSGESHNVTDLKHKFELLNQGETRILTYLRLDDLM